MRSKLIAIVISIVLCFIGLSANATYVAAQQQIPTARTETLKRATRQLKPQDRQVLYLAQKATVREPKFKVKPETLPWSCTGTGNCSCTFMYDCAAMIKSNVCKEGTLACGHLTCECNT
jgi:hypothetical protein